MERRLLLGANRIKIYDHEVGHRKDHAMLKTTIEEAVVGSKKQQQPSPDIMIFSKSN